MVQYNTKGSLQNSISPFLYLNFKITSSKSKINNIYIYMFTGHHLYTAINKDYLHVNKGICHNSPSDCCGFLRSKCQTHMSHY